MAQKTDKGEKPQIISDDLLDLIAPKNTEQSKSEQEYIDSVMLQLEGEARQKGEVFAL